jgi:hypothetical protein
MSALEAKSPNDVHNLRFAKSIVYMQELGVMENVRTVFEVGWRSHFSDVFNETFPGVTIVYAEPLDVRKQIVLPGPSNIDLILFMEVMEHLNDIDSADIATISTYMASGINGFLQNLKPYMQAHTRLFITTPNVDGYKCIMNLLQGVHPYFYSPHHRELSTHDVANALAANGYRCLDIRTYIVWNHHGVPREKIIAIEKLIKEIGNKDINRGDDIFCLATLA